MPHLWLPAGWLLSMTLIWAVRGTAAESASLYSSIVLAAAVALSLPDGVSRNRNLRHFIAGILCASVGFWAVRNGSGSAYASSASFLPTIVASALALVVAMFGGLVVHQVDQPEQAASFKSKMTLLAIAIVTIALYRFAFFLGQDIPNEQRSIVVLGTEVHHGFFGVVLMAALMLHQGGLSALITSLLHGFAIGSFVDQATYLSLADVSDMGYNSGYSWIAPLAFVILAPMYWLLSARWNRQ